MKKITKILSLATAVIMATAGGALATPSTQVWIPSTDVQAFGTVHLNLDNYIRVSKQAEQSNVYVLGPTVGVLPFEKIQLEVGADLIYPGGDYNKYPVYLHAKLGTPEGSLFANSPALAVGGYNIGLNRDSDSAARTDQDIVYALAAKTLPVVGRLSAGYYTANGNAIGGEGVKDDGLLLSWDRTMSEISDKLWLAVDYQQGNSALGALSVGASWAFSKNVSVIFGYDFYNNQQLAGENTFTTQVDINFP